jgi:hypothetical protein
MGSVSIETRYMLYDRGSIPGRGNEGNFSILYRVPTGSGARQASYQLWLPGALTPGVNLPEREADHSPPSRAEVKKTWSSTSAPQYVFMA